MKYRMRIMKENKEKINEEIENRSDLEAYEIAIKEYKKDPTTYSLEEIKRELGI